MFTLSLLVSFSLDRDLLKNVVSELARVRRKGEVHSSKGCSWVLQ